MILRLNCDKCLYHETVTGTFIEITRAKKEWEKQQRTFRGVQ